MSRSIALVGMMGAGKTTVARILAERLGRELVATDAEVERLAGRSIADIFADAGEAEFRRLEREAVASAAGRDDRVVDLGGGVVLHDDNVARLRQRCVLVELRVAPEMLASRVAAARAPGGGMERPLLDVEEPSVRLTDLAVERAPRYAAVADHTVDASPDPDEVADAILAWAAASGDVLSDAERDRVGS